MNKAPFHQRAKSLKKARNNWLVSGDQFFGGYQPRDSFQGDHPKAFKDFLGAIKKTKKKFLFVSGDRHMSEVMKIPKSFLGYESYEITSSPIHSSVYPGASQEYKNPLRMSSVDGKWNYVIVDVDGSSYPNKIQVEAKGLGGQSFFKEKFVF